ncbi:MAG TPA: hypothetical protein VNW29_08095 [Candidatus Sulfotelmatobacter sp.]|nr:hypothetical protein [Candidatus Sulfotelmatobacter sp.]
MRKFVPLLLLLLLILFVFHAWFLPGLLSTFDFLYYSPNMMKEAYLNLYAWDWHISFDGFARFFSPYSWIFPLIFTPQVLLGKYLGIDWSVIERIAYLYPYLFLMLLSPIYLIKYFFPKNRFFLLAVLVFSFNTYSLLLAGGEVFLALAYALAPIIFVLFIKQTSKKSLMLSFIIGIVLSLQIMFDPRITYVTLFAIGLFLFFVICHLLYRKKVRTVLDILFYVLFIPGFVTVLLQAFWLIPTILYGKNPVETLGSAYSASEAAKYFSFAKFENTISLLHPNWPENIFGKIYFMRWEFLFLPIIAFSSLIFFDKKNKKDAYFILYFALLALIGSFFAKGVNDPFGYVYVWMFDYFPGFIMFRDPTKWYLIIALSYSILIPFTVWKTYELLKQQNKFLTKFKNTVFSLQNIFVVLVILVWLFTIRQTLFGQLNGMFKITSVPKEYLRLDMFLSSQPEYFRTVWYPSRQHFGYYSENHPEISTQVLFNIYDDKKLFNKFSNLTTKRLLEEASIKYVIVPYDSEKEIFLTDRRYDESKYQKIINGLEKITWLKPISMPSNCALYSTNCIFGKIAVFAVQHPKDHFWSSASHLNIHYSYINPTKYIVTVANVKKGDRLIFSESFDSHWIAIINSSNSKVVSSKYNGEFTSFILPQRGNYRLEVTYTPQSWVNVGEWISLVSFILIAGSLFISVLKVKILD